MGWFHFLSFLLLFDRTKSGQNHQSGLSLLSDTKQLNNKLKADEKEYSMPSCDDLC